MIAGPGPADWQAIVPSTRESVGASSPSQVICVRGGWGNPSSIRVENWPTVIGVGHAALFQTTLRIEQADGIPVRAQDLEARLSAPTLGVLGGATTALTDIDGKALLKFWNLDTPGNVQLTLEVGSMRTSLQVRVGAFPHSCAIEDELFQTLEGGCKDMSTKLVWSMRAAQLQSWHNLIWDSASAASDSPPDSDDGTRVNDYANGIQVGGADNSSINFCHGLTEGGHTDWYAPTQDHLLSVSGATAAGARFGLPADTQFWSSTTDGGDTGNARALNLAAGTLAVLSKTRDIAALICVRNGTP